MHRFAERGYIFVIREWVSHSKRKHEIFRIIESQKACFDFLGFFIINQFCKKWGLLVRRESSDEGKGMVMTKT